MPSLELEEVAEFFCRVSRMGRMRVIVVPKELHEKLSPGANYYVVVYRVGKLSGGSSRPEGSKGEDKGMVAGGGFEEHGREGFPREVSFVVTSLPKHLVTTLLPTLF